MRSTNVEIRDAVVADVPQMAEIYNSVVLTSTAIYNDRPATLEERTAWWRARVERGFPVLVATKADMVLGYGSFGEFRSGPGYRLTVELTVHIRDGARGQGTGSALLRELIVRARSLGMHVMVGGVDAGNHGSLRFLARHGFVHAGQLREVGFKFGQFLDLNLVQLRLSETGEAKT